ncbi:MAG TPA: maleylacetoacetate isomerase [Steroidobacteraceae bacterium]|jgi:maleylpyruvate isomerase|nr:maleylacetoacetate isomerase [Steroidobacteraceae bacterium]
MVLYGYSVSSASYRVRIALALKGLEATMVNKQLRRGEHRQKDFLQLNPQGFVPALALDDRQVLTQSLAIIEYLEEVHPEPALLPSAPLDRARVRAMSQLIACDIHPLNNLRVLQYLEGPLAQTPSVRDAWYRHWIEAGFTALEELLGRDPSRGRFCHGESPTIADVCLVPQVFNARRFSVDLNAYPRIVAIDAACRELAAFASAAPEKS